MKNRQNKLSKYLIIGVLFLGISLLLTNCQNENDDIVNLQQKNKYEKLFNSKIASQNLGFETDNLYVNWQNPEILEINKKGNGGIYQYNIELIEKVTNNSNLFVDEVSYKLIVNEQDTQLTLLRFEPFKNSFNTSPSETNLEGFSGMKFIFDKKGIIEDIYTYIKGEKIASFNETKHKRKDKNTNIILSKADGSDFNDCTDINGNPISGCSDSNDTGSTGGGGGGGYAVEYVRNYTDWYMRCDVCTAQDSYDGILYVFNGHNYIYRETTEQGNSVRWVWTPNSNNRYINVFNSRTANGTVGPNFKGNKRNFDEEEGLPCPIGFVKIGDNCAKIVEDDQIFNELTDKAKCVYDKLEELSTGFKNAIKKFDGEFPVSHLKFIMEDLGTPRAETRAPDGAGSSPDYVITIAINSNSNIHGASYRPNLMTAKTIAHEVIHAEMFRKLLSLAKQGNLNFSNWTRQQQIDFTLAIKNDFPGIYDYYRRHKDWQHEQMASHYRQTIADILKDFDNNQHQSQFYLDVAWEGLIKSNITSWTDLSLSEKDRIKKVLGDYINANKNETCQ